MSKNISVPCHYHEVKGSKWITVELEIKTNTTMGAIKKVMCHDGEKLEEEQQVESPHEAVFLSCIVQQIRDNITEVKENKNCAIEVEFGVTDGLFMISISFVSDKSIFRKIAGLVAGAFTKSLGVFYAKLVKFDKEFCEEHGKEEIMDSMNSMYTGANVLVMARDDTKKMMPTVEKEIGDRIEAKELTESVDKINIQFNADKDERYVEFAEERKTLGEPLFALMMVAMNMQKEDYIVHKDKIYIRKGCVSKKAKNSCVSFIKKRINFAKPLKVPFSKLPAEKKAGLTEAEFNKKEDEKKDKKILEILEMVYSEAVMPLASRKKLEDELSKLNYNQSAKVIENIAAAIEDTIKAK